MASRTKQKEEARARRLAEERARAERERRQKRMRALGGIVLIAIIVVGVAIAISSNGGGGTGTAPKLGTTAAKSAAASVNGSLTGIPQSGMTIGSSSAPVSVTEYGDLECPICKDFATGTEQQLIANDVKAGKVKLTYRSLETASQSSPISNVFPTQQAAAIAAGNQGKAWNYILLFYNLQGQEGTGYATSSFLSGLAGLVPGLNYAKWSTDRNSSSATNQVGSDEQTAQSRGFNSTPTILVQGPKGQAQPIVGAVSYSSLESTIKSVS
jgi:protein-disulfide isomerase